MGNLAYISFGSNLGDRKSNISKAITMLKENAGEIISISSIYTTPPIGFSAETDFLNGCLLLKTTLTPEDLMLQLNQIETQLGRERKQTEGYTSRPIDLDIIFYNDLIVESEHLQIPHPRFRERQFVLQPMSDITPDFIDPLTTKTVQQLKDICKDKSQVTIHVGKLNANV